ncbi:NAD(P)H-dependent oxidoreductase subunit E [Candidatus Woesearchaeota archaeon]|nr:NAD(P)H-dependent oxidoreductase subunit E [Candidatus Woesearchaeota archaeon]
MSFKDIDEIIRDRKDNLLLPMLEAIQARFGCISEANAHYLSRKTGIPFSQIYGVITFYEMLYTEPKGKYIIRICNSPSCYLNGSLNLIRFLALLLKIKSGETTKNKKFSLEIVSCIGCCDKAPAMIINNKVYGNLTEKKIREIISSLK